MKFLKTNFHEKEGIKKAVVALEKAKINWVAEESPLIVSKTGQISKLKKSIYRSDTKQEIGSVGLDYVPLQSKDAFTFFDAIIEKYNGEYQYAAEVDDGRKVLLYAELTEPFFIKENDPLKKGFVLVNGYDGTVGIDAHFIVERLIKLSGLKAVFPDVRAEVSLKHTKNVKPKVEDAFKIFEAAEQFFNMFEVKAKELTNKKINNDDLTNFLDRTVGVEVKSKKTKNRRDKIRELFESSPNGHTAWDLYNSFAEYIDHYVGKDDSRRLVSSLIGGGGNLKEKAFSTIMKL